MTLNVYIGWDPREEEAWEVACKSVFAHASEQVYIYKLMKSRIKEYKREDPLASSEFTLTRFLVPYLSGYEGFSVFMDCDVLVAEDINKIMDRVDPKNLVSCVKHPEYEPKTAVKMDGALQTAYPRKNWSSVMVFNNEKCKTLTPELINTASAKYLHRMQWSPDALIGELSHTWNYLVGYYNDIDKPNIIHYTDGGPWFKGYENCEFAEQWKTFYEKNDLSGLSWGTERLKTVQTLHPIRGGLLQKT